jgi:hypothetical protein
MRLATGPSYVIDQNLQLIAQGIALCRRIAAADYAPRPDEAPGNAVGPQIRHCIDAYRCFLDGLRLGRVDYDRRAREAALESDPLAAAVALDAVATGLAALPGAVVSRPLLVRADVGPGEDPEDAWTHSSGGRELRGLSSHTVHHYALVAMLLRSRGVELGHPLGRDFGVAPATLAYWQRRERGSAA